MSHTTVKLIASLWIAKAIDSERRQAHISELSSLLLVTLKEAQVFDAKAQCQVINLVANDILQILATKDNDPEEKAINEVCVRGPSPSFLLVYRCNS